MKNFKIKSGSNLSSLKSSEHCTESDIFGNDSSLATSNKSSLCSLTQMNSVKTDFEVQTLKSNQMDWDCPKFANDSCIESKNSNDLLQRIKTLTSIARIKVGSIKMESTNFDALNEEKGPFLTDVQLYRKVQEEQMEKDKENTRENFLSDLCSDMNIDRNLKEMLKESVR